MKIGLILALAILAALSSLALAVEYKTLDTEYFKVEYPEEWTVIEGGTLDYQFRLGYALYDFGIPFKDKEASLYSSNFIQVGLNGVEIRLNIDPRLKGMFNEDGSIDESVIHFLKTFQVKKPTTTNVTAAPEYKIYENEYFKVEYPADWKVDEWTGATLGYDFGIPFIEVGLNGVQIHLSIDPQLKDMFNEDGSINESIKHFVETFKVKKTPKL